MTEQKHDLLSILDRLGEEKRSGRLRLSGEGWSANIFLSNGQVSRVDQGSASGWRLGELLRHVHILSPQRFRKANRIARRKGAARAEAHLLSKGWVAASVYRRFQERLCIRRICVLAPKVGYRAAFTASEGTQVSLPVDVAVPVPFVAKAVAEQTREALTEDQPLPAGEERFRKKRSAVSYILGGHGADLPEGAPVMGITPRDRRVFFFCNGEVPFQDLSLVLGISPHGLAQSLRALFTMNAVVKVQRGGWWQGLRKSLGQISRPVLAFAGGIGVATLVLWLGLAVFEAVDARDDRGWSFESQGYYLSGEAITSRNLSDALHAFFLNHQRYPEKLSELSEKGHLSEYYLRRQVESRAVGYSRDDGGEGYSLSVGKALRGAHRGRARAARVPKAQL